MDLSVNCEDGIYDPNGSGIQILGIRSRDPFSGSTGMSVDMIIKNETCIKLFFILDYTYFIGIILTYHVTEVSPDSAQIQPSPDSVKIAQIR